MQKLLVLVVVASLLSFGGALPGSAADTYGSCGVVASSSVDYPQVGTGYVVTDDSGVGRCYPIQDPARYVCIDGTTRSNEISGYGTGVGYTTNTFTDIYVLVTQTKGDGQPLQQVRLYEKVGTMDGGDVTSFQTDELTNPTISDLAAYLTSEIGFNFGVDQYMQTNKAVKGEEDITFTHGSAGSQIYHHAAIIRIGPLTNRREYFSISFYRHVQQVRSTDAVTDPQPPSMPVVITYNGTGGCPPSGALPEYDTSTGSGSTEPVVGTLCSYDNCDDDFSRVEHSITANGGISTGILSKDDGTRSTTAERAQAGLVHDCMSSGGTMLGSGSCGSDPVIEWTCVEVVSESKPGQTAYLCE